MVALRRIALQDTVVELGKLAQIGNVSIMLASQNPKRGENRDNLSQKKRQRHLALVQELLQLAYNELCCEHY